MEEIDQGISDLKGQLKQAIASNKFNVALQLKEKIDSAKSQLERLRSGATGSDFATSNSESPASSVEVSLR